MDQPTATVLRIGDWRVDPTAGQISRAGESVRVEARTMRLLVCLAEHAGEVVSIDRLLDGVWAGVVVTPDSVYQAVASLRRLLGDDPKNPAYIATVPRLGYRMVASVSAWVDEPLASPDVAPASDVPSAPHVAPARAEHAPPPASSSSRALLATGAALLLALVLTALFRGHLLNDTDANASAPLQRSVAVLPFLDLTAAMDEEPFADGMTEELIGKLSRVPGLRVPSPTSSFYLKGKQLTVAQIAKSLSVAYVLDGSVRKSGPTVRVAARLIRVEDGFVVWSENYDRPFDDILKVQDDIAAQVTKALSASLASAAR
jgi:TolB-like protein/DNA-binding winged helix-turn-helix (wHTH) protein